MVDAALDLVVVGLEAGVEGAGVLPIEEELLVLELGVGHGLEDSNDLLEVRWKLLDGLEGCGGARRWQRGRYVTWSSGSSGRLWRTICRAR